MVKLRDMLRNLGGRCARRSLAIWMPTRFGIANITAAIYAKQPFDVTAMEE